MAEDRPPTISYRDEVARKAVHLASVSIPLGLWILGRDVTVPILAALVVLALLIEFGRLLVPAWHGFIDRWMGWMMRHDESRAFSGATFVVISGLICSYYFQPKMIAVAALLFLSISDALASLVGRAVGGPGLFGKSFAGNLAFFLSAALIVLMTQPVTLGLGLLAALVATIVEALPLRWRKLRIDDNFSIPISAGLVMTFGSTGMWIV